MGKKRKVTGVRVVVDVELTGWDTLLQRTPAEELKTLRKRAEDVRVAIRRHVDDGESAYVEELTELVCEHCGYDWTEGEDAPHNGGCCDEDVAVMEKHCENCNSPLEISEAPGVGTGSPHADPGPIGVCLACAGIKAEAGAGG